MADDLTLLKARMIKLLEEAAIQQEKMTAIITEAQTLVQGGDGIGVTLKRLEAYFDGVWASRYAPDLTVHYVWRFAQDRAALKRLLKALDVDEIERRMERYIRSDEAFYVRARHPFAMFVAAVNSFAAAPAPPDRSCHHDPPCEASWACYRLQEAEATGDTALVKQVRDMNRRQSRENHAIPPAGQGL